MPLNFSQRKPISEGFEEKIVQRVGGHTHEFIKDGNQNHPTLTAYSCKKCGYGLLVDESVDSINNYQ
jgi:predicted nucleic-acid-binding Zn-ribbon protein